MSPILTSVGLTAAAVVSGATKAIGDSVSFAAEVAKKPFAANDSPVAAATQKSPEELRDELVKQLRERIQERLKAAGINVGQPIVLEASPSGSLRVKNDHPQWRAIEQVLGEDESFASGFAQLQAAAVATGVDEYSVRDLALELNGDKASVITPR